MAEQLWVRRPFRFTLCRDDMTDSFTKVEASALVDQRVRDKTVDNGIIGQIRAIRRAGGGWMIAVKWPSHVEWYSREEYERKLEIVDTE